MRGYPSSTRTMPAHFLCRSFASIVSPMNETEVLPITVADLLGVSPLADALLALNNDHAQELSWLEPERLKRLVGKAFFARRIGHVDALLLAFDQDADYDSPNFHWFRSRYPR